MILFWPVHSKMKKQKWNVTAREGAKGQKIRLEISDIVHGVTVDLY